MVAMRSVSYVPGNRLLMVTLLLASLLVRARPATKPVKPLRAPLLKPKASIGALTELDVMLTIRALSIECLPPPTTRRCAPSRLDGDRKFEEPEMESVLREINRGVWTIGYTGQSPERLKLHMKHMNTFDVKSLRAKGGPCAENDRDTDDCHRWQSV